MGLLTRTLCCGEILRTKRLQPKPVFFINLFLLIPEEYTTLVEYKTSFLTRRQEQNWTISCSVT